MIFFLPSIPKTMQQEIENLKVILYKSYLQDFVGHICWSCMQHVIDHIGRTLVPIYPGLLSLKCRTLPQSFYHEFHDRRNIQNRNINFFFMLFDGFLQNIIDMYAILSLKIMRPKCMSTELKINFFTVIFIQLTRRLICQNDGQFDKEILFVTKYIIN